MLSRTSFLGLAALSILVFGCSSTTGVFFADAGPDGARPGDGGSLKFDTGVKDSGPKLDTGIRDTGFVEEDTSPPTMTCETCQSTYCASQASACSAEKACTDTLDCIQACADDTCANNCVTTYGSSKFMPWYNCLYDNCQDSCFEP